MDWRTGLVTGLVVVCGLSASRAAITSAVNTNSVDPADVYEIGLGDLANGELVNVDRTHAFMNLPAELEGLDYVLTANDDKTSSNVSVMVGFDIPTTLYLSIDNRVGNNNTGNPPALGNVMGWVLDQGWQQTDMSWVKQGDTNNPFTVYRLVSLGGSHTFYEQNNGGSRNMYSIAADALAPGPFRYALLDIGPNGQRVEPGATALAGAPNSNVNLTDYGPVSLNAVGTFDAFDLEIASLDWRDRGDAAASNISDLVLLGEDFVKHNDGTITLVLNDLLRGRYTATSYHHDPDNTQSPRIQVFVSDAVGEERLQPAQGDASQATTNVNGLTAAVMTNSSMTFEFYASGSDPVTLRFNGTPGTSNYSLDDETPVNGLELILDRNVTIPAYRPFALIDFGPNTQRVEAGGMDLPGAPNDGVNGSNYGPVTMTNEAGEVFSLTIDNVGTNGTTVGRIDWRDRGDSTGTEPLVRLGEDHVKNNRGIVRVTLGGLPAGLYRVESMHIDAGNILQCEDTRVYVTDAGGSNVPQDLSGDSDHTAMSLDTLTTVGIMATASAFFVEANGTDDVVIVFDGTAAVDTEVPLNGLRLQTFIPEPVDGTTFIVR
jgi:hypothetical protein